jgi:hypothetical protein
MQPGDAARDHESRVSLEEESNHDTCASEVAAAGEWGRGAALRARSCSAPTARKKLLAFASLILLLVFFSFASPVFMQMDNIIGILQATAVNGVLAIACTFVIITGGIDLSVGTMMTFAPSSAAFSSPIGACRCGPASSPQSGPAPCAASCRAP